MGISGRIAKSFLTSELTPLLAIVGLLLGTLAVVITPKEEEPQINVTFANVFIAFPGASVKEVEQYVSTPAEQVLSEIKGIKHVYSVSQDGLSILTVQFKVGEDRTQAIVRLYNKLFSNQDWLPNNMGVAQPIIKPMGIDDVPIVSVTLWSKSDQQAASELKKIAHSIEAELKRIPGTRDIYTIGGPERVVHIVPDISKLNSYGLDIEQLSRSLQLTNHAINNGTATRDNKTLYIQTGTLLRNLEEIKNLVISVNNGAPVFLRDVAQVTIGADQAQHYVWFGSGPSAHDKHIDKHGRFPAVTIAIAKQANTNAVDIANTVIRQLDHLRGTFIPDEIGVTITRNYGETASEKANQLIGKLAFATAFVVLLVLFTLGIREAVVVGSAVLITLALTLFASWAYGFTINRVSLFALIFSIGILVDDAIVVVENIHRHMAMGGKKFREAIPLAVDEVGSPTILATFAVIAALLPMAFVSGLMGPYMSPIPINASMGMLISLAIAFIVTPWMSLKLLKHHPEENNHNSRSSALETVFTRYMSPFLNEDKGRNKRQMLLVIILLCIAISVLLPVFKWVVLKMLPFDNKSEFQIVVDLPENASLEKTDELLNKLADHISKVPEVTDYQIYSGTAAPVNFNGLVRQYYLRSAPYQGDIQVNLQSKSMRDRKSHEIAQSIREAMHQIARPYQAAVKIVEVPPGPPVLAPIVAEIYGPDSAMQQKAANTLRSVFENATDVVDIDTSNEHPTQKWVLQIDRVKAARLGLSQQAIINNIARAIDGYDVSYFRERHGKYPVPIRIEFSEADKGDLQNLLTLSLHNSTGEKIYLSEVVKLVKQDREQTIYHKDLQSFTFVSGDLSGELDSPLYGMFDIYSQLGDHPTFQDYQQFLFNAPNNPYLSGIKWDGEWQITFETFRDMGLAYAVGIILIYFLVVAQFRSYWIPIIIMVPIPLTVIGVMPGHALLGAQFTATSMIGMIALAGIIVRNSILLVDFIKEQLNEGIELQDAVIKAGAVRAKPIILTGLAAMLGALFILDDPIFNGLAISLIAGVLVSTLLTLFVIPIMFYAFSYKQMKSSRSHAVGNGETS